MLLILHAQDKASEGRLSKAAHHVTTSLLAHDLADAGTCNLRNASLQQDAPAVMILTYCMLGWESAGGRVLSAATQEKFTPYRHMACSHHEYCGEKLPGQ